MDVQETRVRQILEGAKQYLVPLYQRPYAWEAKQRDRLWTDILDLVEERRVNPDASHFMGSLVLSLGAVGPGGTEFLVVDGQQRLTTISILLCALRDYQRIHLPDNPMIADAIHEQFISDRYKSGDTRLKVLPTQADRDSYRAIVDGAVGADTASGIGSAYSYFRRQLELADDPEDKQDINRIQDAVLSGLVFVSITAKQDDNVYRIFESLNNTGLKLTQGDLVRNYLFMRLNARGEAIYSTWWLPMQRKLSSSDLEWLFWLDAVAKNPNVKQTEIYASQHQRLVALSDQEIEADIERFARLADLLVLIRHPDREIDFEVARRLTHLMDWGTTTVVPILLRLLDLREQGKASSEQIASAMSALESFLVRRTIVGGPGAGVNKILLQATLELKDDVDVDITVHEYLSAGRKYFATDDRVRAAVLREPFYLRGRKNQQKLILAWIEESMRAKEVVDVAASSIEHVMPQTLTAQWRDALMEDLVADENVEDIHEELVHTLGNLTLSGYNSELSNREFEFKKTEFSSSGFTLNQEISSQSSWGRPEILARGAALAERVVSLWKPPLSTTRGDLSDVRWELAHQAVMTIPAGSWTTYGDLAALIGTHPVPMGQHLATVEIPGAWRVLQAAGTISPGFRWHGNEENREPRAFLEAEGLRFDDTGRADPVQRLRASDLAARLGIGAVVEDLEISAGREASFIEQLSSTQVPESVHGVIALMRRWEELGGSLQFGSAQETSCFFVSPRPGPGKSIWPFVIYPSRSVEVVFQHLVPRAPFDDIRLREELRRRLNDSVGVDLPPDSLERRPSFPVEVLAGAVARENIADTLEWFVETVVAADTGQTQPDLSLSAL